MAHPPTLPFSLNVVSRREFGPAALMSVCIGSTECGWHFVHHVSDSHISLRPPFCESYNGLPNWERCQVG
jgi:hypothetical protein